jgi:NAD-dependent dihydropyrimidine dehydrogenase PreA subunit
VIQIGKAKFTPKRCVVVCDGTDCGACGEYCPAHAIKMIDFRNGLKIPKIDRDLCIGCGGCEYICPVRPKAIFVVANAVHEVAALYQDKERKEVKVEGFGF